MKTKRIVIIGLLSALCFVGTLIHIPLPFLGPNSMMHLGTVAIYISVVLIGPQAGWAGAIGCALISLVGYFITDVIIYGNWVTAITSTIGSLLTSGIGIVMALVVAAALKPSLKKANITV